MQDRGFRRDIAALRTVAVVAVVLFHFGVPGMSGGYVGVDVFFVISGYLMTGIVTRGLERGGFSVWAFYRARAERIIPALTVLCAVLGVVGLTVLDPMTSRAVGTQIVSALTFTSNILFWSQDSYFAAGAETKWLLHTWSLSVEWQFYLIFPIAVALIWRLPFLRNRFGGVMLLAAGLSFAVCALAATQGEGATRATFFWLPFRAWEMLLGGLVVCYPKLLSRLPAPVPVLAGLALIVGSIFAFGPATPWPAWNALLPTLGTAMVIWGGGRWEAWAVLPGMQALGAWSYSIYLWHWPIVVALAVLGLKHAWPAVVVGIVLSVVAGAASYALIEMRMRRGLLGGVPSKAILAAGIGLALPLGLGGIAAATEGLEAARTEHMPSAVKAALADERAATNDRGYPQACNAGLEAAGLLSVCRIGDPKARDVLVIGDSHAQQTAPRLARLFESRPGGVTLVTRSGCPVLTDVNQAVAGNNCAERTRAALDYAIKQPYRRVVLAAFWSGYVEPDPATGDMKRQLCFVDTTGCRTPATEAEYLKQMDQAVDRLEIELRRLRQAGKTVVLVLAVPYDFANDPHHLYAETFARGAVSTPAAMPRDGMTEAQAHLRDRLVAMARRVGAEVVDPRDTMCDDRTCPATIDGRVIYSDNNHLRASMITLPPFAYIDRAVLGGS